MVRHRLYPIAILGGVLLAGCSPSEPGASAPPRSDSPQPTYTVRSLEGANLVVIAVDGLRADRLGAYGHDDGMTPFLDSLAEQGLVYTNAAANSSVLPQSLAALFTGRLPTCGGTIGLYEAAPQDQTTTWAQYFSRTGYYTGLISNQPAIMGRGYTKGFEEIQVASPEDPWPREDLVRRAGYFLEDAGPDRFFLYLHFSGPPLDHHASGDTSSQAAREKALAAYDADLADLDGHVRDFLDLLRDAGRYDNTALIFTSSHGAELFDHGYVGAGWTLHEEVLRVPLILVAPGRVPAGKVDDRVSHVDLLPTILTLFGLDDDGAHFDGHALFQPGPPGFDSIPHTAPHIAELIIPERCVVRSVEHDGWKYVAASLRPHPAERDAIAEAHEETANAILDGSRQPPPLWGNGAYEALFHLDADTGEQHNVLGHHAGVRDNLAEALAGYREHCREHGLEPRMATRFRETLDAEDIADIESLGYS